METSNENLVGANSVYDVARYVLEHGKSPTSKIAEELGMNINTLKNMLTGLRKSKILDYPRGGDGYVLREGVKIEDIEGLKPQKYL